MSTTTGNGLPEDKNQDGAQGPDPDKLRDTGPAAKTTEQIVSSFRALLKEPNNLTKAVNYLYETLIDDATVGIFMEMHHLQRTGNQDALDGATLEESNPMCDLPDFDIFGISTAKKPVNCLCPSCERMVAAARFAPHLQTCLGIGRAASRRASRRLASSSRSSSASADSTQANGESTDDEDDVDWSLGNHNKKPGKSYRNKGSKKPKSRSK